MAASEDTYISRYESNVVNLSSTVFCVLIPRMVCSHFVLVLVFSLIYNNQKLYVLKLCLGVCDDVDCVCGPDIQSLF